MGMENSAMFTHDAIMTEADKDTFARMNESVEKISTIGLDWAAQLFSLQDKIDAMLREYDKALADPQTKMPTTLHALIEALRP